MIRREVGPIQIHDNGHELREFCLKYFALTAETDEIRLQIDSAEHNRFDDERAQNLRAELPPLLKERKLVHDYILELLGLK